MAEAKRVLVVSADSNFVTRVKWTMAVGGYMTVVCDGTPVAEWAVGWSFGERFLHLIIIDDSVEGGNDFVPWLRGRGSYFGPILVCAPDPKTREVALEAGADEVCESWQWIVPAHELLGLMVKE